MLEEAISLAFHQSVISDEKREQLSAAVLERAATAETLAETPQVMPSRASVLAAEADFNRWSKREHVRCCPHCRVPILKNGGCQHMKCASCRESFVWSQAPLLRPCRGIHYQCKLPFVQRCTHNKLNDLTPAVRAELKAWTVVYYIGACPIAVPFCLIAMPTLCVLKRLKERQKRLAAYRRRPITDPLVQAEIRNQLGRERARVVQCRTTGNHPFVGGWCPNCGAIE